jgi:hypothetical protein
MVKELFEKALRVETEEIKEVLLYEVNEFTDNVCEKVNEFLGVTIKYFEFYELVMKEAEERNWDIRHFRNSKNETILNLFKRLIRNICKERGIELSNDTLSKLLNIVRNHYSEDGVLSAGLYPAEAFIKRAEYGIPDDLGDTNSCFRDGGCNEGSALWLESEWKYYNRAWLVVFHYKSGNKEGVGRCWAYKLSGAVYATNFYSYHFEIKDDRFKRPVIRLIRKLFALSESVKYATGKNAPLPIYLNGDGIVIYEPSQYKYSEDVLDAIEHLYSRCLWCSEEIEITELRKYDESVYFSSVGGEVKGLIVCSSCSYELENLVECIDCGEYVSAEDAYFIEGVGYVCGFCFEDGWFYCDRCGNPERSEYVVITPDGEWLCEYCASKLGAICVICGEFHYFDNEENFIEQYEVNKGHWLTDVYICSRCAKKHLYKYQCQCGRELHYLDTDFLNSSRLRDMVRLGLCLDCYCKRQRDAYDEAFGNREHPSLFTFSLDPGEKILREILYTE